MGNKVPLNERQHLKKIAFFLQCSPFEDIVSIFLWNKYNITIICMETLFQFLTSYDVTAKQK